MKTFVSNSATLETMMRNAMARFDADREQATLASEYRADNRATRAWSADLRAKHYRKITEPET